MKVSDILTLVAVLAAGAGAYFAYDSWQDYAGPPFDEAARDPKKLPRYAPKSNASRAPLIPTRKNRETRFQDEINVLNVEQTELARVSKLVNGLREDNTVLSDEIMKATSDRSDLQQSIQKKNRTINDNQEQIRKYEEASAVAKPEELKRIVEENIRRLNEANTSLAREKDLLAAALQRKASMEDSFGSLRRKESMQAAGEMEPNFRSTVREAFSRWGFVIINAGASQGVNARTKLHVVRRGEKIAELQVTTVEPSVSVCAILAGSSVGDVLIAPGDSVVVAPVATAPIVETPKAPAAPAPAAPAADPAAPADPFGF